MIAPQNARFDTIAQSKLYSDHSLTHSRSFAEVPTIPNNNNNEIFQESFQSFDEYYYYYQLPKKSHTKLEVILRFFMVLFQWVRDQQQELIQQETDMAL